MTNQETVTISRAEYDALLAHNAELLMGEWLSKHWSEVVR